MPTKISELPETTTPASSVEMVVVDSGTTKKSTLDNVGDTVLDSRLGWFDVGHNGSDITSIGTSATTLLVDAASGTHGGYGSLPTGVTSALSYNATDSEILTSWLEEGQAFMLNVYGELTTSASATSATLTVNFYNSSDSLLDSMTTFLGYYKSAGSSDFSANFLVPVNAAKAASGAYAKVTITFDTGASNEVDMGGFTLAVLK